MMIACLSSPGRSAAITSSTTASSLSTRCTRLAPRTASAGVFATFTLNRSRARALLSVRFHTVIDSPRRAAASTKPLPSSPVPRYAMWVMSAGVRCSRVRHLEIRDVAVRVVREADAVDAIRRLRLSFADDLRLVVRGDRGAVDDAAHLVTAHSNRDVLAHRLPNARGLVNRRVRLALRAVQLERSWTKPARDEHAVAVRGTIEVRPVWRTQVVAADENPVWVRMIVQVLELRFAERRAHRVVAARRVRRIPECHGRPGRDVQLIAFFRQLVGGDCSAVGLALPTRNRDAAVFDGAGGFLRVRRGDDRRH